MFKWFKKKVAAPPAPQLSELGAEIMEAMQNPDEWEAGEYVTASAGAAGFSMPLGQGTTVPTLA
jgi:hypothetical protein